MRDKNDIGIYKPIFIVGCPRSGTSILHQIMRLHPDLAYVTPATNLFDNRTLIKMVHLYCRFMPEKLIPSILSKHSGTSIDTKLPETSEGHNLWNRYYPRKEDRLLREDVTLEIKKGFERAVLKHLRLFRAERFISKNPRHSLKIPFIDEIFQDALFVHVLRDGRAVANSIYSRRKKEVGAENWWGLEPPNMDQIMDKPPIVQCGLQWKRVIDIIQKDLNTLGQKRQLTVRYEDFAKEPNKSLKKIFDFLELETHLSDKVLKFTENMENRNWKWKKNLTPKQQKILEKSIEDKLKELKYL